MGKLTNFKPRAVWDLLIEQFEKEIHGALMKGKKNCGLEEAIFICGGWLTFILSTLSSLILCYV